MVTIKRQEKLIVNVQINKDLNVANIVLRIQMLVIILNQMKKVTIFPISKIVVILMLLILDLIFQYYKNNNKIKTFNT